MLLQGIGKHLSFFYPQILLAGASRGPISPASFGVDQKLTCHFPAAVLTLESVVLPSLALVR